MISNDADRIGSFMADDRVIVSERGINDWGHRYRSSTDDLSGYLSEYRASARMLNGLLRERCPWSFGWV